MKLMTPEVVERLRQFPLMSQEGKGLDAEIVVKIFDPAGRYTFFVTDAEEHDGDWYLFGYCVSMFGPDCDEWGSVMASELQAVRGRFGLGFERDLHIAPGTTIRQALGLAEAV
jgi:hypothetical protein